jgi:hypothetical protein
VFRVRSWTATRPFNVDQFDGISLARLITISNLWLDVKWLRVALGVGVDNFRIDSTRRWRVVFDPESKRRWVDDLIIERQ